MIQHYVLCVIVYIYFLFILCICIRNAIVKYTVSSIMSFSSFFIIIIVRDNWDATPEISFSSLSQMTNYPYRFICFVLQ